MLSKYLSELTEWDSVLPHVMCSYRAAVHSSTGVSSYYVLFGKNIMFPFDVVSQKPVPECKSVSHYVIKLKENLLKARNLAKTCMLTNWRRTKALYDLKTYGKSNDIGDFVFIYKPKGTNKFRQKWSGPYQVSEKLSEVVYKVKNQNEELTTHFENMKLFKKRDYKLMGNFKDTEGGSVTIPPECGGRLGLD